MKKLEQLAAMPKHKIHYMVQEPIDLEPATKKAYNVKTKAAHSYVPSGTLYFTEQEIEAGKKEAGLLTMFDQNHKYYLEELDMPCPWSTKFPHISHAVFNALVNEVLIIQAGKTEETFPELQRQFRQKLYKMWITLEENFCLYYHHEDGSKHILGKLSPAEGTVYIRCENEIKPFPIHHTLNELYKSRTRVIRRIWEENGKD